MSIMKTTDIGHITISDELISDILYETEDLDACRGKLWISSPNGTVGARRLGLVRKPDLKVSLDAENRIHLSFHVVMLFGTSIRLCTHAAADYIAKTIEELFGTPPAKITINIAGVKSKHVVKRSTKVEYVYEA